MTRAPLSTTLRDLRLNRVVLASSRLTQGIGDRAPGWSGSGRVRLLVALGIIWMCGLWAAGSDASFGIKACSFDGQRCTSQRFGTLLVLLVFVLDKIWDRPQSGFCYASRLG